jgi:glycosyltransferase involved in cell wall biosynthesis
MESDLPNYEYEHIFSDNSSTDSTVNKLKVLAKTDKRIKIIVNSRNVGPFRNMWNALKSISGDMVIPLLPADLQDPPNVIPAMVHQWEEGKLVVYGIRSEREEFFVMRGIRSLYYKTIQRLSQYDIPVNAGEFCLVDRRVMNSILETDDHYPYIRGLIAQTEVLSGHVEYTWAKRRFGKSKNTLVSLIDQAINGFVSTSRMPARFALLGGFILAFLGIIFGLYAIISFTFFDVEAANGIPTIIVGIFLSSGVQLIFLGIIGEYVMSIHGQVRRTPSLLEIEKINF